MHLNTVYAGLGSWMEELGVQISLPHAYGDYLLK